METEDSALLSIGAVAVDSEAFSIKLLSDAQEKFEASIKEDKEGGLNTINGAADSESSATVVEPEELIHDSPLKSSESSSILHTLLSASKDVDIRSNTGVENGNKSPHCDILTGAVETEEQRRIRTGEMTPFGNVLNMSSQGQNSENTSAEVLNVSIYLENQITLQKQFRQTQSQKRRDEKKQKRRRISSEDDESGEEDCSKTKSKKKEKVKDPLNVNILFPKPHSKKTELGTKSSKNKADIGKSPGLLLSEETSIYLSGDSDYKPDEDDCSDSGTSEHFNSKKTRNTKVPKNTQRKQVRKDSSSEYDSSDFDDYEKKKPMSKKKKIGEYTDDGNFKFYQERVQKWKESETRLTKEVHTLDGGFKLPKYLWNSLFKYQKVGVQWLWELHQNRSGGILSDEMGLGKTIQVICFLAGVSCGNILFRFSEFRGIGPSLIVCPATVMNQWVSEFRKWWPPFRIGLLHESGSYTGDRNSFIRDMHQSRGFIITTYSGIVQNQDELYKYTWDYIILDEGHKIRNPDAKVTIAVKRIATPHRIILSGSPLQNNLKELWSLFDFITPGRLGTLPTFLEKFAVPITQGGYANASDLQVATAYKCATTLRDLISPYLLRRMKSDVSDHLKLPPKNEQVLFCKLTDEQRDAYTEYLNSETVRSVIVGEHNLFVALINLRKICNHIHLFDGGPMKIFKNPNSSSGGIKRRIPKQKVVPELIPVEDDEGEDIETNESESFGHWHLSGKMIVVRTLLRVWKKQEHKVLLFTQSRQMLCILEKFLQQESYSYLRLDGGTTIGNRQTLIDKFNRDKSVFVFLLTTRVGGLGVNLTGANRVVIFDPDWNPSTDLQARERAWRIGQDRECTIYRLITSGTIEEKIYHRQIFKQFLTNRVLKDPRQKRFFKKNDLMELFSYNDGTEGTETEAIFVGTDSHVKRPRKRKHRKDSTEETTPRENSHGKFKGVPSLVKQRPYEPQTSSEVVEKGQESELSQDDYVLRKLFKKSSVEACLKHDKIVDGDQPDLYIVEKEAERVAKEAVTVLKKSREQCWKPETGRVTWTGSNGSLRKIARPKKTVAATTAATKSNPSEEDTSTSLFSRPNKLFGKEDEEEPLSSNDLLAIIKARKRKEAILSQAPPPPPSAAGFEEDPVQVDGPEWNVDESDVDKSKMELLADIRSFVAFRGTANGEVSTSELVNEFKDKLPPGDSPLFKEMLKCLCSSRKVQGRNVWKLKPEFR